MFRVFFVYDAMTNENVAFFTSEDKVCGKFFHEDLTQNQKKQMLIKLLSDGFKTGFYGIKDYETDAAMMQPIYFEAR